jgi:hypothetical protein
LFPADHLYNKAKAQNDSQVSVAHALDDCRSALRNRTSRLGGKLPFLNYAVRRPLRARFAIRRPLAFLFTVPPAPLPPPLSATAVVGGAPAPFARTISDAPITTTNDKAPTLIAFKKIDFIELLLLECLG